MWNRKKETKKTSSSEQKNKTILSGKNKVIVGFGLLALSVPFFTACGDPVDVPANPNHVALVTTVAAASGDSVKTPEKESEKIKLPTNKNITVEKLTPQDFSNGYNYKVSVNNAADKFVSQSNLSDEVDTVTRGEAEKYKDSTCLPSVMAMVIGFFHPEISNHELQMMVYDNVSLLKFFPELKNFPLNAKDCNNGIYGMVGLEDPKKGDKKCDVGSVTDLAKKVFDKIGIKYTSKSFSNLQKYYDKYIQAELNIKESINKGNPAILIYIDSTDPKKVTVHAILVTAYVMNEKGDIQHLLVNDPVDGENVVFKLSSYNQIVVDEIISIENKK